MTQVTDGCTIFLTCLCSNFSFVSFEILFTDSNIFIGVESRFQYQVNIGDKFPRSMGIFLNNYRLEREDILVDHCGYGLAAGEAELHDVGELAAGVVHREVVGDD